MFPYMLSRRLLAAFACAASACLASCAYFDTEPYEYQNYSASGSRNGRVTPSNALNSSEKLATSRSGPEEPVPGGPLAITLEDAILLTLQNNRALSVQRLEPPIQRTFEDQERAVFDPTLAVEYSASREHADRDPPMSDTTVSSAAELRVGEEFPSGTGVDLGLATAQDWSDAYSDEHSSLVELTVTQALLNGAGLGVNLASLRQARLDTLASGYELRGLAEALVADTEATYWEYALAERRIEIFQESLTLAEQQQRETEQRIAIGSLPETELAAAQAEVALRSEDLINARSSLAATRLQFLRLLNPPGADLWGREIVLRDKPATPEAELDTVESHVQVGLSMRPDLNEAHLRVQRGHLEIVKTRNGLLPRLDLFITLGKTGYADSFGESVNDLGGDSYAVAAGVSFEYPLGNRDAKARQKRAVLTRRQAEEAVSNLAQLVQLDVRTAYIEVDRTAEQVAATAATRKLQEEKLRAETEKFRVGRSTTLLVAQAQRDLVASRISEVDAVVNHLKALTDLFRLEGSLLERRGISADGP